MASTELPVKPHRIGVITAFPPGRNSLNEFGYHLVRCLTDNACIDSVEVFCDLTDSGCHEPIEGEHATATFTPSWKFNSPFNVVRLVAAIKKANVDAVIINLQFATFGDKRISGGLGLLVPALLKKLSTPTGVILHNLVENVDMQDAGFANSNLVAKAMDFAGRSLTKAILRADYVAVTIPRYVELLQEKYGAENALLTPHGSFEEIEEPSFGIANPQQRDILAFGKWGTYKTVDVLIDAYRDLLARGYDDLTVTIAGSDSPNSPGYLAEVQKNCADLAKVRFTGYVEEEDVPALFTQAAVTAFPYTSTTGSSGVLHQAGSYGRAAVLPAIGDFVEIIEEEGFVGSYFEPGNATSLADALAKLLDDDALNAEQGRRNFLAATGIPMTEVVDWHIFHIDAMLARNAASKS